MAKFKVVRRPSGLINGQDWPEVGEVIDLPDSVGNDMSDAGWLEKVEKKTAAKKADDSEKRPASKKGEETR